MTDMVYDPELESEQKDWCQAKGCGEVSDIIYKRKGYCSYHFEELFSLQTYIEDEECDCDDCTAPTASHKEAKTGVVYEQRTVLNYADAKKEKLSSAPSMVVSTMYESIEDYTAKTGKRFRMTKDQKSRNLTREQAFKELHG